MFQLANHGLYLANSNYLTNETNLQFEILNLNLTQTLQINNRTKLDILHETIQEQKLNTNILKNKANNLPNDTDALSDTKLDILMQTIQRQRKKKKKTQLTKQQTLNSNFSNLKFKTYTNAAN